MAATTHASPRILSTSAGRGWSGLEAALVHVPRGRVQARSGDVHAVGIHFGAPVRADCVCDGRRRRGVQKQGDIDIIPAGVDGAWEDDADCRILRMSLAPALVHRVAEELGHGTVTLAPQMQLRDTRIEAIGWAIKADLEAEVPSDPLYVDALAHALAVRLIETARGAAPPSERRVAQRLSARQLRILTDFIESNLDQRLGLHALATVAGMSVTRLKTLFRNSVGMPVHQYVLHRRVAYARVLMETTARTTSDIAFAAGFAHQSHMTTTMRKLLGQTPRDIRRHAAESGPMLQKRARS